MVKARKKKTVRKGSKCTRYAKVLQSGKLRFVKASTAKTGSKLKKGFRTINVCKRKVHKATHKVTHKIRRVKRRRRR